ncbi:hypothetical protein Lal_00042896 [Lupinus albus]|nr:hypothetical protein Lal_00042896 [Lupinus albus]
MKTIANRPRRSFETGGPSSATPSRPTKKRDPYFTPELQASRLVQSHGRKLAYVCYADVPWLVEEGFQFPHELEVQGTNTFIGLHGKLYSSLIREFYSNFVYKNGQYITMVKGKLIVLDEELFLAVGGLSSSGEPLGNCENEQWNDSTPHGFRPFPPLNLKNTSNLFLVLLNGTLECFGEEKATMEVEGDGGRWSSFAEQRSLRNLR